jgi:hypothetical protein
MTARLSRVLVAAVPALMLACVLTPVAASATPAAHKIAVAPDARLSCHASMTNSRPRDYTSTGVRVRSVRYAYITTVAHYRTVKHAKHHTANVHGRRTIWYYISGASPGYRVVVDVYVSRHGHKGSCSTSFVPRS